MRSLWKPYALWLKGHPPSHAPPHPMPTKTLKSCLNELLPVITALVNSSLQEGVFPDALKEGLLHPKIKKTSMDKEDLNNFRPITNLAFLSKVIEKSVACQTRHYLTVNNLYPKLQAAYQQFQSTETALLRVHNDILRALDDKKEVILVLLDLSAAFDTIDHQVTYTIWIHWESSTVVHFVPTRPLPKSRNWKCKIGTQTSILWSPPKICFGAIVIHFILRPSWRSDQISRPWLHVFCWWLAALHHSEASWETHYHSQPRTLHLCMICSHFSWPTNLAVTLRRQKSSTSIPDTRTLSQWPILLSVIIPYLSATKPAILALYLTNT